MALSLFFWRVALTCSITTKNQPCPLLLVVQTVFHMHSASGTESSQTGLFHHYVIDNKWFSALRLPPLTALGTKSCATRLGRSIFMTGTAHGQGPSKQIYSTVAPKAEHATNQNRREGTAKTREVTPKTKGGNWFLQLLFRRPEPLRTNWFVFQLVLRSVCQSVSQSYMKTD